MEDKDYQLVFVADTQVGLIGLKTLFERLKNENVKSESQLRERLVEEAGRKNYIPSSIRKEYEKALFREFKKYLGEKVEEEGSGFLNVIILGQGCYSCNQLEQDVMSVLSETGIQASVSHITDPTLIAQYGNPLAPALLINGTIKSKGILPMKSVIKKWLEEEKG